MNTVKLLLICSILALSATFAMGQEREITEETYWAAIRTADSFQWKTPVRITQYDEHYESGVIEEKGEIITERLPPDRLRVVERKEKSGKVEIKESINVAGKFYCKEKRSWKRSNSSCAPSTMSVFDSDAKTRFSVSDEKVDGYPVLVYRLQIKESPRPTNTKRFPDIFEYITWVDSNGRMIRQDRFSSISSSGEKVFYRKEVFEYNPKGLKIFAPIK